MHRAKFGWNWLSGSGKDFKILLFPNYPLKEERGPSFEQPWFLFTHGFFVSILVEKGLVVLEKKIR